MQGKLYLYDWGEEGVGIWIVLLEHYTKVVTAQSNPILDNPDRVVQTLLEQGFL